MSIKPTKMLDGGKERVMIKGFNYLFRQIIGRLVRAPAFSTYVIPLFVDAQDKFSVRHLVLWLACVSHVLGLTKLVPERNFVSKNHFLVFFVGMGQTWLTIPFAIPFHNRSTWSMHAFDLRSCYFPRHDTDVCKLFSHFSTLIDTLFQTAAILKAVAVYFLQMKIKLKTHPANDVVVNRMADNPMKTWAT